MTEDEPPPKKSGFKEREGLLTEGEESHGGSSSSVRETEGFQETKAADQICSSCLFWCLKSPLVADWHMKHKNLLFTLADLLFADLADTFFLPKDGRHNKQTIVNKGQEPAWGDCDALPLQVNIQVLHYKSSWESKKWACRCIDFDIYIWLRVRRAGKSWWSSRSHATHDSPL